MEQEELATAVLLSPTRDPAKNGEIAQRWMEMVLGEKFRAAFPAVLLSGERLCDLANRVFRALGMAGEVVADKLEPSDDGEGGGAPSEAAMDNVRKYLSACEAIGVDKEDLFEPDDLLQTYDIGRVYRNILALQCVAVSMSSRRSIDERSSLVGVNVMDTSPLSEHGIFDEDDEDQEVESPSTTNLLQQTRWQRLLFEYEYQLLRQADQSDKSSADAHEGVGQLAHDIWRTEERIRTVIARQDRDYGLVPDDLHGKLWMLASGAQMEMRKHKGLYERLVTMESTSTDATMQIDVDLHRTVPDADKDVWDPEKTKMMRRVLVAYSFYNPSLGYCQGLNYIVARSLQYVQEEEAFYLLIKMIKLVPDDYYTTMLGLAVDQHVFADLVRIQLPDVAEHLGTLGGSGMDLSLACTEWFLTLFASPCERDVTIQVWDSMFLFGDELLFRVALALLQSSKDELLKAAVYGDILNLLNELGKNNLNPVNLLKSARRQDAVICARIDEFRAHHRLQLASGLVAYSDRGQSGTGRTSTESKSEPRVRQLLSKKKKIFRADRNAGRLSRTFERNLNDDHMQLLRKDDQSRAKFYEGDTLVVVDGYWGSKDSYRQWGSIDNRKLYSSPEKKEKNAEQHEPSTDRNVVAHRMSAQTPSLSGSLGSGHGRERRSKSSAFIPSRKSSNPSLPIDARHSKDDENDSPQYGRSPKSWLQKRIDEWQKKNQKDKEKKKQEKRRHQLDHRTESEQSSTQSRLSGQQLTPSSSAPQQPRLSQFKSQSRSSNGTAFDRQRRTNGRHASAAPSLSIDTKSASELALSRSFSDPFHSPTDSMRPSRLRDPARKARHDAIDSQILIRSQDTDESLAFSSHASGDSFGSRGPPSTAADAVRPAQRPSDKMNGSSSKAAAPSTSAPVESCPRSNSRRRSGSKSSSREGRRRSGKKKHQQQEQQQQQQQSPEEKRRPLASNPLAEELMLDSPIHDRSLSVELTDSTATGVMSKPEVRRNVSLPAGDPSQSMSTSRHRVPRNPKRLTSENAQAIRERAHVVSYIQRKASDASSLTGSFPVSPRERLDMAPRLSTSSSDSSREAIVGSNRSTRYRKGSFSFFEKLTSDLESFADAFPDDDDDSDDEKQLDGASHHGVAV